MSLLLRLFASLYAVLNSFVCIAAQSGARCLPALLQFSPRFVVGFGGLSSSPVVSFNISFIPSGPCAPFSVHQFLFFFLSTSLSFPLSSSWVVSRYLVFALSGVILAVLSLVVCSLVSAARPLRPFQ